MFLLDRQNIIQQIRNTHTHTDYRLPIITKIANRIIETLYSSQ